MDDRPTPPLHLRRGLLGGLATVALVGALAGARAITVGVRIWTEGNTRGAVAAIGGLVLLAVCALILWIVRDWWAEAGVRDEAEVADLVARANADGAELPFVPVGATPRGSGLVVGARPAFRIVLGLLAPLVLLTAFGMGADGVHPVAVWIVTGLGLSIFGLWLWARSWELCLDSQGIWRRRVPKWRVSWRDLERLEVVEPGAWAASSAVPDVRLHGRIETVRGERATQRLRLALGRLSANDLLRVRDWYTRYAKADSRSPFHTWS